jgi:hypothetical protein
MRNGDLRHHIQEVRVYATRGQYRKKQTSMDRYDRHCTLWGGAPQSMECQRAARRLKRILRSAERLDITPQDLARLPGVKNLLAPRAQERSRRFLQTLLPVICTVLVFAVYCYCNHHENNGSKQSLAGHYDDMVSRLTTFACQIGDYSVRWITTFFKVSHFVSLSRSLCLMHQQY